MPTALDQVDQPAGDIGGVTCRCVIRMSWNPKTYIDLTSPGVVVLDATVILDVMGLRAFDDEAALVQVLPGSSPNIVRVPS